MSCGGEAVVCRAAGVCGTEHPVRTDPARGAVCVATAKGTLAVALLNAAGYVIDGFSAADMSAAAAVVGVDGIEVELSWGKKPLPTDADGGVMVRATLSSARLYGISLHPCEQPSHTA